MTVRSDAQSAAQGLAKTIADNSVDIGKTLVSDLPAEKREENVTINRIRSRDDLWRERPLGNLAGRVVLECRFGEPRKADSAPIGSSRTDGVMPSTRPI